MAKAKQTEVKVDKSKRKQKKTSIGKSKNTKNTKKK